MKRLEKNWFCSNPIDLEQKQYILLDFLQSVQLDFSMNMLFPTISEIQSHVVDLSTFRHSQSELRDKFKKIKKLNFYTMEMEYEYDDSWITKDLKEVHRIVEYSIPELNKWSIKGKRLFDEVSSTMRWEAVGLIPSYKDEGYFIIHLAEREIFVYRFKLEKIVYEDEKYIGITTDLIDSIKSRLKNYEDLKLGMIKKFQDLPFPFTLSINTGDYPLDEAILPIIKREGLIKIKNGI